MARLIWKQSDGSEKSVDLAESTVLGRSLDADCVLQYRGVSRQHSRIERDEVGNFHLVDLNSTNGTLINGVAVLERTRLRDGDRIQMGSISLQFVAELPGPALREQQATEPLSRTLKFERLIGSRLRQGTDDLPEVLPRRFGKFHLLEKLGQGGMGDVYRAQDLNSGQEVAVKLIRPYIGRRESFLEFFHNREAVLAREISHPNVVRVLEYGVEEDRHFISMEYVDGENLYRAMKRSPPRPWELLEILRQAACGLAAAHRQGVVHSDVKPGNVLLRRSRGFAPPPAWEEPPAGEDETSPILEFDPAADAAGAGEGAEAAREVEAERESRIDPALLEEIHRRIGERPPRSPSDSFVDFPFFERASEMRFLDHYYERAKEGRGFLVLVEGEPGVGKKRLISEFLLRRRTAVEETEAPARFLEFDGSRMEGIPHLYEQITGRKPGADFNLLQIAEELKDLGGDSFPRTVIRILDFGRCTPLACWLVSHWATRMDAKPLLLIASLHAGGGETNDSVKDLIETVRFVLKEIYLRPLTEYQIQRYLEQVFSGAPAGSELASDLYRLSGGNFSRIFEILRNFLERGLLVVDSRARFVEYRPSIREFELEEGKNLYEKYRAYSRVQQQVLEHAAFIGPVFFFDLLRRLVQVDETPLYFVVRQLMSDGFLVEVRRTWYRFTNLAFHRYMAERIPPPERPHLHRKMTRLLQAVAVEETAEVLQLRGYHFAGCREYARAVQSYLDGAHLARNVYQMDLARDMYQEILHIYRSLASKEKARRQVTAVLREWFRRDGNWYEILGELGSKRVDAWVKIADFGISFRTADEDRGYRVGRRPALGTPRYIAPERGRGEYGGPRSDIFALGIIAYELVTGQPPFPELDRKSVVEAYQHIPIRLTEAQVREFPPGFRSVVHGMLAIDPAHRWDAEKVIREIVKLQFDLRALGYEEEA
ncbi:MAG: protein kinase [Planctomycetes bacterium]|nr:protein kinase [Planctomycetota bacterium]